MLADTLTAGGNLRAVPLCGIYLPLRIKYINIPIDFFFFTKVKCNLNNKQYFCNKNDKMHCAKNGAHIGVYVHIYIDVFMDYLCTNARDWLLRPCKSVREYECVRTGTSAFLWLVKNYLILLYFNCLLRQGGSNNPKSLLLHWPA